MISFILLISIVSALILLAVIPLLFRVIVPTNEMHIVQSSKKTVSYGKGELAGNSYYRWPSWIPRLGIRVIKLPVSVFDVKLESYAAYDKGRVPFVIDIMAFFRVTDSNLAAARLSSVEELLQQLEGILQGACRSILAKSEIEEILEGRATFGELFTKEVDHNLREWGVQTVKIIELMDIRDAKDSRVIENIMAKKKSLIEMQSRTEVADNRRKAELAEISAQQEVKIREQEAHQLIGMRTAEKEKQIGISNENAKQEIKEQERITAQKQMAVVQVNEVRASEIAREVQIVKADQQRQTSIIAAEGKRQTDIITAEGQKQQITLIAEGALNQSKYNAQGIEVEGLAKGSAEQAILLAPVNAQITLAKEIGGNEGYQKYLLGVRDIEKSQIVGVAQSEALKVADIKIIVNGGSVSSGVNSLSNLMSSDGGTQLGAMVEAINQTPVGNKLINKLVGEKE